MTVSSSSRRRNRGIRRLFACLRKALPLNRSLVQSPIVLVIDVSFVTSSDSASLVIDTITAGAKIDAPVPQRIFWASFEDWSPLRCCWRGGLGGVAKRWLVFDGLPLHHHPVARLFAILQGLHSDPANHRGRQTMAAAFPHSSHLLTRHNANTVLGTGV